MGFRPFVYRIAKESGVTGDVSNDGEGVLIHAEGRIDRLEHFLGELLESPPPLAVIEGHTITECPLQHPAEFTILESDGSGATRSRRSLKW